MWMTPCIFGVLMRPAWCYHADYIWILDLGSLTFQFYVYLDFPVLNNELCLSLPGRCCTSCSWWSSPEPATAPPSSTTTWSPRRWGTMLKSAKTSNLTYFPSFPVGVCAGFPAAVGAVHLFDLVVPGDALRDAARAAVHRLRERHPRHGQTGGRGESSKSMCKG